MSKVVSLEQSVVCIEFMMLSWAVYMDSRPENGRKVSARERNAAIWQAYRPEADFYDEMTKITPSAIAMVADGDRRGYFCHIIST